MLLGQRSIHESSRPFGRMLARWTDEAGRAQGNTFEFEHESNFHDNLCVDGMSFWNLFPQAQGSGSPGESHPKAPSGRVEERRACLSVRE